MLSRVANSLYWMSRYLERAENTARIADASLQLLLDFRDLDDERLARHWTPIVQSLGEEERFDSLYPTANGQSVTDFLVFRADNPNSIVSAIAQARENARVVRDQITADTWEEINRLHLFLRSGQARQLWQSAPDEFFNEIKRSSLYLQGLMLATVSQTETWHFLQTGKYLERADKTTRLLDVRHQSLPARGRPGMLNESDALDWVGVLRSCSGLEAYRQAHGAELNPALIAEMLILSDEFPRSVRFCLDRLDRALHSISGTAPPRFCNDVERLSGRLLAELQFGTVDDIFDLGLHEYVDQLQVNFNADGDALFSAYIFLPFVESDADSQRQQQQ
ncbi:MAG TPA: alpha-E domain-containing protein [Verrucomicrobiota bacterium]|nr:alpha-E domain-containing protein [Verrucomicrobiota bacterium]